MGNDVLPGPPGGRKGDHIGASVSVAMRLMKASRAFFASPGGWLAGYAAVRASLLTGRLLNWMQRQTNLFPRTRSLQSMVYLVGDAYWLLDAIRGVRRQLTVGVTRSWPLAKEVT